MISQENAFNNQKSNNDRKRKSLEDSSSSNSKENSIGTKKIKPLLKLQDFKFMKKN